MSLSYLHYFCFQTEWQTKPSKKRKPQGIAATGDKSGNLEDDLIENHLNEEEDEKSSIKPNKPSRGGKRGGWCCILYNKVESLHLEI